MVHRLAWNLLVSLSVLSVLMMVPDLADPRAARAQTIVDEWGAVSPPPAPALKPVTLDPKATAFLILDIQKQTCNAERRPRCVASVPKLQAFLRQVRDKGVPVVYSLAGTATAADILPGVAPLGGEPVVIAGPDKFLGTELEKLLRERGVQTVIVVGTAAHGAVLHTAAAAALRGLKVVLPVDGMSAEITYAEQYTAWHLGNAPRVGAQVTLTRLDLIQFP